ncbi:hypothetical protein [Gracilimonas sp. BCB1]|uniref:hypothetical protein n=1 Tax=Gracilimonas sp. BCB1 TaxID=3152362 RepID=UPI0032D951FD
MVIKEKVIISPIKSETTKERAKTMELLPLDNPSLIQLDFNRFLVVRSGNLSFRLNSGQSIPNYRLEGDSLLVTLFKPNGTVNELPSKTYHNQLIAPYLTTNRFGTDSTYWYQKFSEEYSDNFFNSTYVSNLNCVVLGANHTKKEEMRPILTFLNINLCIPL